MNEQSWNIVTEYLKKARELIEHGWVQGRYADTIEGKACYCALGAINHASEWMPAGWQVGYTGRRTIKDTAHYRISEVAMVDNIALWNDAPGQTQSEVLAAFDKAIAMPWPGGMS